MKWPNVMKRDWNWDVFKVPLKPDHSGILSEWTRFIMKLVRVYIEIGSLRYRCNSKNTNSKMVSVVDIQTLRNLLAAQAVLNAEHSTCSWWVQAQCVGCALISDSQSFCNPQFPDSVDSLLFPGHQLQSHLLQIFVKHFFKSTKWWLYNFMNIVHHWLLLFVPMNSNV